MQTNPAVEQNKKMLNGLSLSLGVYINTLYQMNSAINVCLLNISLLHHCCRLWSSD